ncbi:MAG TPA: energy transducer TonB, partial [Terriglobia bacterium]|nr:energy transducer TonB [Terriglobia bacterium]
NDLKSTNDKQTNLDFSLPEESRWVAFWENLKGLFVKAVASSVSATPAETDLLLASTVWYSTIFSNLKSVVVGQRQPAVTAHPVENSLLLKVPSRFRTLCENLAALLRTSKATSSAIPVQTDLLLEAKPWFRTIFSDLPVLFAPRSVYVLSAQPVAVSPLFRDYRFRRRAAILSIATHFFMVAAILWLPSWLRSSEKPKEQTLVLTQLETKPMFLDVPLPPKAKKSGGGGGGGRREKTPASLGKLPRFSDRQLTPPTPKIVNPKPVLPVEPTVVVPQIAQLPPVSVAQLGDPLGIPGPPSSGPGTGGGIGTGTGGGVGPGKGPGVGPGEGGGLGGGPFRVGGGVSAPIVVYRIEPNYSEDARRARYQGSVVLSAIVRKDGSIQILKVVRGLGLGLDENAVEALRQWKFRPGTRSGEPVDVALNIEINFALR